MCSALCFTKANKDGLFGKSDPFYIISKRREGTDHWVPCFKSGALIVTSCVVESDNGGLAQFQCLRMVWGTKIFNNGVLA